MRKSLLGSPQSVPIAASSSGPAIASKDSRFAPCSGHMTEKEECSRSVERTQQPSSNPSNIGPNQLKGLPKMTRAQEAYLSVAKSDHIPLLMQEYGFEFAGPSHKDVWMFRETTGKAWMLTDFRGKVAPCRMILPSFWCQENIATLLKPAREEYLTFCCNEQRHMCRCNSEEEQDAADAECELESQ